ncbi:hypothetical protein [Arthrobacter sp. JSM 101049]
MSALLVIMSNRRSLMGDLRNRWWHNTVAALGMIAILATSVRLLTTLLG